MDKLQDVRVKYTHPAIPPVGIDINKGYLFADLIDNYKLDNQVIKTLFKPIDTTWDKLENKNSKKSVYKEVATEDLDLIDERVE